MEARLFQSLRDPLRGSLTLTYVCDFDECRRSAGWSARWRFSAGWAAQASQAAQLLRIDFNVVLITALSVAMVRVRAQTWVPLTLVVAARDQPGDAEHVSMLSTYQHLDLDF